MRKVPAALVRLGAALLALPALGLTQIIPLDTLVANHGSVSAGDVTFNNFQKPTILPQQVGILLGEFNDIGVTATATADGAASLAFVGIDPASGLASPLTVGPAVAGEIIRLISYSITVTNPALRLHSVAQSFGPGTLVNTSETAAINLLYGVEPVLPGGAHYFDGVRSDQWQSPLITPAPVVPSLLPGGNLAAYNVVNEFGLIKGHLGFPPGGAIDSIAMTFWLVPTGAPVPPVVVNLAQVPVPSAIFGANDFLLDPDAGVGSFVLTNFAQDGGAVITLTSSNPAAVAVPPTVTVRQGYWASEPFLVGPPTVDLPTDVTLTWSFNGRTRTGIYTAKPITPLAVSSLFSAALLCGDQACPISTLVRVMVSMNRTNVSPETIVLTSSNPAVCPIQASLTLPALTSPSGTLLDLTCKPVGVDTPITFSATFNGATISTTAILPRSVDVVKIGKAELVVKNLSLKVDATSGTPSDVLTLFNAATGQLIGIMTNTGLNGTGGKYSFQGTVSAPVQTLLVRSTLNGTATGASRRSRLEARQTRLLRARLLRPPSSAKNYFSHPHSTLQTIFRCWPRIGVIL